MSASRPLRIPPLALGVGIAGVVVCAVLAFFDPMQFFRSYLVGLVF